jgi:hypothetical protein
MPTLLLLYKTFLPLFVSLPLYLWITCDFWLRVIFFPCFIFFLSNLSILKKNQELKWAKVFSLVFICSTPTKMTKDIIDLALQLLRLWPKEQSAAAKYCSLAVVFPVRSQQLMEVLHHISIAKQATHPFGKWKVQNLMTVPVGGP